MFAFPLDIPMCCVLLKFTNLQYIRDLDIFQLLLSFSEQNTKHKVHEEKHEGKYPQVHYSQGLYQKQSNLTK